MRRSQKKTIRALRANIACEYTDYSTPPPLPPTVHKEPCKNCGHNKSDHKPPKFDFVAKSGASSGKAHAIAIEARTSCFKNPLCCCTAYEY